jgi:hypothetical protein
MRFQSDGNSQNGKLGANDNVCIYRLPKKQCVLLKKPFENA